MKKRPNGEGSVFQRKDGRWCTELVIAYKPNGLPDRKTFYGRTQKAALKKLDDAKRALAEGRPVSVPRQTLATFLERWLDDWCKPNLRPKTHKTYRDLVDLHIAPALGHFDLNKLSAQNVQWFVKQLGESLVGPAPTEGQEDTRKPYSPTTVKHCRDCLRAALNVAKDWKMIGHNPAERIKLPPRQKRKPQVFDKLQARKFLDAIKGDRLEALFMLTLCLGTRQGEVLGLRRNEDLDLEGKRLHIRHALQRIDGKLMLVPTKTEESQRSLRLPAFVASGLAAHLMRQDHERKEAGTSWRESGMLFTTTLGTMLDSRNMLRSYYRLIRLSGLPPIRFHDLRHSAATILHVAGVPTQAIKSLLGHASAHTTQEIYMHITPDAEDQAAEKMQELLNPVAVTVAVKKDLRKPS